MGLNSDIAKNPIKQYKRGYPCMLKGVLGRIVGESEKGSWGKINGEIMYSIPIFATPHGTIIETGVMHLSEIDEQGEIKLRQMEAEAKRNQAKLYGGLWNG